MSFFFLNSKCIPHDANVIIQRRGVPRRMDSKVLIVHNRRGESCLHAHQIKGEQQQREHVRRKNAPGVGALVRKFVCVLAL